MKNKFHKALCAEGMSKTMIKIDNLTKIYSSRKGKTVANDNISLNVNQGEIIGLLGHNGAGKTTLVNQIIGLVTPTNGDISVLGQSVTANPSIGRYLCAVQPQSQLALGELSPMNAVMIMGQMRGGKPSEVKAEATRLFEALDIMEWAHKESITLSGGVKRLMAFCMAVIAAKQVIILDEPTNDVDPVRRRYLWSEIKKLTNQGRGVMLVTHNVNEAENVVDRVVIMHHGKIIREGTVGEIRGAGERDLRLEFSPTSAFDARLPAWAKAPFALNEKKAFAITKEQLHEGIDWARTQVERGTIFDYSLSESTLEDVYVNLTGRAG